jgi:sigma-B regulation protein RsbU (phosphoserine phosphatase)
MLAAFDFATYDTMAHSLQPRDRLLLYTDGIVEAANSAGEFFGQENLGKLLQATNGFSVPEAADHIIHSVENWASSQDDDLTVLVCDYVA